MKNQFKEKLKRRGNLYSKYHFNSDEIINDIINCYDNNKTVDESRCEVIFNVTEEYREKLYELIRYYPNKLKEVKYITDKVINEMYLMYGETITIMKTTSSNNNVRGRLCKSAKDRVRNQNIKCDIINEDIILVKTCPYLNINLEYGNSVQSDKSPSLDRIIPSLGYVKGNIQVISTLSNKMKSNSSIEELITFSKNVLKLHG